MTFHLLPTGWVVQRIRCLPYNTEVLWFESTSRLSFSTSIIYTWRHWRHNLILIKIFSYHNIFSSISILRHILLLSTIFIFLRSYDALYFPAVNISKLKGVWYHWWEVLFQRKKDGDSVICNTLFNKLCCHFLFP